MNRNKLLLMLLFSGAIFTGAFAQQKMPHIWNTVPIADSTLMSYREVSIKEWMNFIVANNFESSLFPDTACLTKSSKLVFDDLKTRGNFKYLKLSDNIGKERFLGLKDVEPGKNFRKIIDTDPDYFSLKIPVTGISFEQAQKFCLWKEALITSLLQKNVSVQLPSVETYKKVIPNIDTLSKNCKCIVLNSSTARLNKSGKGKQELTQGRGLENISSYFPTDLGLYNIQGNAAEMTSTYGVAMGGSYKQTARESYNDRQQNYSKPEGWLGFRYIVTLK